MKPRIKEVIVVEGRYDRNALAQVVDATVVETGGFSVFNNREKLAFLRRLAEKRGLILLTDPDGAGFVIRNYLKGAIPRQQVKQASPWVRAAPPAACDSAATTRRVRDPAACPTAPCAAARRRKPDWHARCQAKARAARRCRRYLPHRADAAAWPDAAPGKAASTPARTGVARPRRASRRKPTMTGAAMQAWSTQQVGDSSKG